MKTISHDLRLRESITFEKPVGEGGSVVFHSPTVDLLPDAGVNIDNTSVNILTKEGDYLLHISVRRRENAIVFNSRMASGGWGNEERVPLFGVFQQTNATVTVRIQKENFVIVVDGIQIKTYNKRISKEAQGAAYGCNSRSVFCDVITVTVASAEDPPLPTAPPPATSYQQAYFSLKASDVAKNSENDPYDIVIIGSGIGGGVLAADLLDKNKRLTASKSDFTGQSTTRAAIPAAWNFSAVEANLKDSDDRSLRILVVERGGLIFNTHSLNMPRPTSRGTYGQMNDLFYNHFKSQWDMDEETAAIWKGGPVYCLGGRSTVWGLFSPRVSDDTFRSHFPAEVYEDLNNKYLRKAEETMNLSYPHTLPLHRALIDSLNLHERGSPLPTTQWEWGRVASEFVNSKNFDFAEGAYSTVDRLVEAAMDDQAQQGDGKFKILIDSPVSHLLPPPQPTGKQSVSHVVVKNASGEHKIRCKKAVICAGAVESPAILLRSAGEATPKDAYGKDFAKDFGHVTDHYIFFVTLPFFYRNMANKDLLGGMKLQTDITFTHIDNTTALANVSLDASSFLPRRNVPDSDLPQFIIAYILPSELARDNNIELNDKKEPRIEVGYASEPDLDAKKATLVDFAVDVMNKMAGALDLRFVKHPAPGADYTPLTKVTKADIELGILGPGGVAHEMGSIPMPDKAGKRGVVDKNLKMQTGWDNVYVCDLSVFPYSPAANPTLTLGALAERLSEHLLPEDKTLYQPIIVYNVTTKPVFVSMTLSKSKAPSFGPTERILVKSGGSQTWKRETKETIFVYQCACAQDFNVQLVQPGVNALIVTSPPEVTGCTCSK